MTDVVRLKQHRRTEQRSPVKQRISETHLRRYILTIFCQRGYPKSLDIYLPLVIQP